MTVTPRLSADERRKAVLDTALRVFGEGSYRGTTTAEIAREAGVTEPVLYRHFASKRDLYLAAIEEAWTRLRAELDEVIAATADPRAWIPAAARVYVCGREAKLRMAELWMQATVEAGDDPEVRRWLKRHMREVHRYFADQIRRTQAAGAVNADRDADAEAWIFLAGGLLGAIGRSVGGLLSDEDFDRIRASRRTWMVGETI